MNAPSHEIFSLHFATLLGAAAVRIGTPLAFTTLGEVVSERAGVVNLGLEGNMLCGALSAVAVEVATGNPLLAVLAGGAVSALVSLLHATLTHLLGASQVVCGIAISFLGAGVTALLGARYVGVKFTGLETCPIPGLSAVPVLGPIFADHDLLTYGAPLLACGVWWLLQRTRWGLEVRACGENPETAARLGIGVHRRVLAAVSLGGFLAGLGGAHLALAYAHTWTERMTAGQGWLAVGLVILARWRPSGALLAAYFFGVLTALHTNLQAVGVTVSHYLVAMLPYVLTIAALVWRAAANRRAPGREMPAALGRELALGRF